MVHDIYVGEYIAIETVMGGMAEPLFDKVVKKSEQILFYLLDLPHTM